MNPQVAAVAEVHAALASLGLSYALIGGIANQFWGRPRLTRDVDLTIVMPEVETEARCRQLVGRLRGRLADAVAFAVENRVLLLAASNGIPVDVSLGLPGFEEEMIARAVELELGAGTRVRVATAEDLVVLKVVAGRPQDLADVEGILIRQGHRLDIEHVRRHVGRFASLLDDPAIATRLEDAVRRAGWSR